MKKQILFAILSLAAASALQAAPITPGEALARLSETGGRHARAAKEAPQLVATYYGPDGLAAIYVYTYSGSRGFMLLAADDSVRPLLGYSETNSFAAGNLPEQVDSWLSYYAGQISDSRELPAYQPAIATRAGDYESIRPLLETQWDQGAPYNNECPIVNKYRSVTGCVATAMAQVMKYWEYPLVGKGSVTYIPQGTDLELTLDFSKREFDWENMQNTYGKNYGNAAGTAVARLMQACGYSVKMKYSPTESGAYAKDIPGALTTYFGYDQGVSRKQRSEYSSAADWNDLIYNQLAKIGPVIYSGRSTSGGHCFVCDGYDADGFFHINWGWSGMSDGYFLLEELTPKEVGTGGHYGGYNLDQEAVVGIMPPVGRLSLEELTIGNAADDSGNVKGWGYTYRVNDFRNILVSLKLKVAGGHISSPLYATVYETDPDTKKYLSTAYESAFEEGINASDGSHTYTQWIRMQNYDVGKLYTLTVAYDLKGERTTIGSLRLAASSGVDDVAGYAPLDIVKEGDILRATGETVWSLQLVDLGGKVVGEVRGENPSINLRGVAPGMYLARAQSREGDVKVIKLLLK